MGTPFSNGRWYDRDPFWVTLADRLDMNNELLRRPAKPGVFAL